MHFDFSRNNIELFSWFRAGVRYSPACAYIEFSRLRLEYKVIKLGLSVCRTLEY